MECNDPIVTSFSPVMSRVGSAIEPGDQTSCYPHHGMQDIPQAVKKPGKQTWEPMRCGGSRIDIASTTPDQVSPSRGTSSFPYMT